MVGNQEKVKAPKNILTKIAADQEKEEKLNIISLDSTVEEPRKITNNQKMHSGSSPHQTIVTDTCDESVMEHQEAPTRAARSAVRCQQIDGICVRKDAEAFDVTSLLSNLKKPDCIRRLAPSPYLDELVFNCELSQDSSASMSAPAIVDTGCGGGYLLLPTDFTIPFAVQPGISRPFAQLADGSRRQVHGTISVRLDVAGITKPCSLFILDTTLDQVPTVLFGRYLLDLFSISTSGGRRVTMDGTVLVDTVRRVSEPCSTPVPGMVELDPPVRSTGIRSLCLLPELASYLDQVLAELASAGRQNLPRCGASVKLSPLAREDIRDTEMQSYSFQLSMDKPPSNSSKVPRLYSACMFKKLNPADQDSFRNQVLDYVKVGWWAPVSRSLAQPHGPPANVFGVRQKKLRLVADFRDRNLNYPSSSTPPFIPLSLALLRMCPSGKLVIGDIGSAFYKIRLTAPCWVHVGNLGDYLCSRMCFGLSFGPEGLENSLGTLWRVLREITAFSGAMFVDDFWLHDPKPNPNNSVLDIFLYLLRRCGFDVNDKLQIVDIPDATSPAPTKPATILGVQVEYRQVDGKLCSVIACDRSKLLKFEWDGLSRKKVFELAGMLAYDPVRDPFHAPAKILADLLRSVAGRYGSTWDERLSIAEFAAVDSMLFTELIKWAKELISATTVQCHHAIPIPPPLNVLSLQLTVDASHSGGAFMLQFRPLVEEEKWYTVFSDCWVWNKTHVSYHINRLEALSLFRALRSAAQFLKFQSKSRDVPATLSVFTDSSTALAWATRGCHSEGLESRAIERLVEGLRSEIYHLRDVCSVFSIAHLPGTSNGADGLSRILPPEVDTLVQKRNRHYSKTTDPVRLVADATGDPPLAELLSTSSWDIFNAVESFAFFRVLIRRWKEISGSPAGGGQVATATPLELPLSPTSEDLELFCLSAQSTLSESDRSSFAPPKFTFNNSGVITHHRIHYNGALDITFLIPKMSPQCQRLIVRTYHRIGYHRGAVFTTSSIRRFWLQGVMNTTRSVLRSCFRCAVKNASPPQFTLPTATNSRELELPPLSRIAIDHLHLQSVTVLSVMCIDTGLLVLMKCDSTGTDDSVTALQRVANRYFVKFTVVRCDRAAGFTSPKFLQSLEKIGHSPVLDLTVPNASYTNPVERLHREVISIIRSQKFLQRCLLSAHEVQASLDDIAHLVNLRPIGRYVDPSSGEEDVLTPAALALGGHGRTSVQLRELRRYFYDRCFESLRRVQQVPKSRRSPAVMVGQPALYYNPKASKLESPFQLAKVIDIRPPYYSLLLVADRKEIKCGAAQLTPLHPDVFHRTPIQPYDVLRTGAVIQVEVDGTSYGGRVVKDWNEYLEVQWEAVGDRHWANELVAWGACRVVQ